MSTVALFCTNLKLFLSCWWILTLICSIKHKIHLGKVKLLLMTRPNGFLMVEWLNETHILATKVHSNKYSLYAQTTIKRLV